MKSNILNQEKKSMPEMGLVYNIKEQVYLEKKKKIKL